MTRGKKQTDWKVIYWLCRQRAHVPTLQVKRQNGQALVYIRALFFFPNFQSVSSIIHQIFRNTRKHSWARGGGGAKRGEAKNSGRGGEIGSSRAVIRVRAYICTCAVVEETWRWVRRDVVETFINKQMRFSSFSLSGPNDWLVMQIDVYVYMRSAAARN